MGVDELVAATKDVLARKAVTEFETPIELASGQMSTHFVDGKAGLSHAEDLKVACRAMDALVQDAGIEYEAVGGLTLGADHLSVGVAMVTGKEWFIVRKEAKKRGTGRQIEGSQIGQGSRVVVVDDVVSTGGSLFLAIDTVLATGATVVAALTLLDRGDHAAKVLLERGIPYFPVSSYRDFGIPPVASPSA